MMRPALAIVALCSACAHGPGLRVAVRGDELTQHLDALGTDGKTELATLTTDGKPAYRETVFLNQTVTFRGETTTLAKIVDGCGPFANATVPCTLGARELVVLRSAVRAADAPAGSVATSSGPAPRNELDEFRTVVGVISLGSLAGAGLCLAICETHKAAISLSVGGVGALAAIFWLIMGGNVRD
jgi:hypothetical protein